MHGTMNVKLIAHKNQSLHSYQSHPAQKFSYFFFNKRFKHYPHFHIQGFQMLSSLQGFYQLLYTFLNFSMRATLHSDYVHPSRTLPLQ